MSIEKGAQFDDVTYSHEFWERESRGSKLQGLAVQADHPKYGRIGEMALSMFPDEQGRREVRDVGALLKGHGVGTGMWRYAQEAGLNPKHSAERTDEGDRWARHVGGELPPRKPV